MFNKSYKMEIISLCVHYNIEKITEVKNELQVSKNQLFYFQVPPSKVNNV